MLCKLRQSRTFKYRHEELVPLCQGGVIPAAPPPLEAFLQNIRSVT